MKKRAPCAGCPAELDPEDDAVIGLAAYSLEAIEEAANSDKVQVLERVVKATSQVKSYFEPKCSCRSLKCCSTLCLKICTDRLLPELNTKLPLKPPIRLASEVPTLNEPTAKLIPPAPDASVR